MSDMCVAMDDYVVSYNEINGNAVKTAQAEAQFLQAKGLLDVVLNCQNNTFLPAFGSAKDAVTLNIKLLNDQLTTIANQVGKPHTYTFNITTLDDALKIDFVLNDTTLYNSTVRAIFSVRALDNIVRRLITASQCSQVYVAFQRSVDSACSSTLLSVDLMWAVFLAVAIVQSCNTQCAHLAYKRFRKQKFYTPKRLKKGAGVTIALLDDL